VKMHSKLEDYLTIKLLLRTGTAVDENDMNESSKLKALYILKKFKQEGETIAVIDKYDYIKNRIKSEKSVGRCKAMLIALMPVTDSALSRIKEPKQAADIVTQYVFEGSTSLNKAKVNKLYNTMKSDNFENRCIVELGILNNKIKVSKKGTKVTYSIKDLDLEFNNRQELYASLIRDDETASKIKRLAHEG